MKKACLILFILAMNSIPITAQGPHTLYGYVFYGENIPAYNFSITVINLDRNETIEDDSSNIYRNKNYYQIEVGWPYPDWQDGEEVVVMIEGLDYYPHWKGNASIIINNAYPNQRIADIHLMPPPPSISSFNGTQYGYVGISYNFSVIAIDANNFNISYGWDWENDGIIDEWSEWLPSGYTCKASHSWNKEGVYEIRVIAKNEYNISNSTKFTIQIEGDNNPPNTWIVSGPSGLITYNNITFTWNGSDDITDYKNLLFSYKLEGYDENWSAWMHVNSHSYYNLPNGEYTFKVRARDLAGNIDAIPASRKFIVEKDNEPPKINFIEIPSKIMTSRTVYFEWTAEDNLSPSDKIEYSYILLNFSNWTKWNKINHTLFSGLENGEYIFILKAKDEAGNIAMAEIKFVINVSLNDTSLPIVNITNPKNNESVKGKIKIRFVVKDNDKNLLISIKYFDGKEWHELMKEKNISFYELDTKKLHNGNYIIAVYATDSAGNIGYDMVNITINNKKTPGFCIILLITAILFLIWKKKMYQNN